MLQTLTNAAHEPTLAEELDACGHDDPGEMANLREDRTGVPGVIFISTRMGRHGPRVKWYEGRPDGAAPSFSVSIAEQPALVASSVEPRLLQRHAGAVADWVAANHDILLTFWNDGVSLFEDERDALLQRLKPLG